VQLLKKHHRFLLGSAALLQTLASQRCEQWQRAQRTRDHSSHLLGSQVGCEYRVLRAPCVPVANASAPKEYQARIGSGVSRIMTCESQKHITHIGPTHARYGAP